VFQQTIVIPIDMNCAPLLSELLLRSYMRQTSFKSFLRIKIEN